MRKPSPLRARWDGKLMARCVGWSESLGRWRHIEIEKLFLCTPRELGWLKRAIAWVEDR
jgi:hypothetical protein